MPAVFAFFWADTILPFNVRTVLIIDFKMQKILISFTFKEIYYAFRIIMAWE